MTMTKESLISQLSTSQNISKQLAKNVFEEIFETIKQELVKGDKFTITGFGTFTTKERAARQGRNPQTGEIIQIPPSKTVSFKIAPALKSSL